MSAAGKSHSQRADTDNGLQPSPRAGTPDEVLASVLAAIRSGEGEGIIPFIGMHTWLKSKLVAAGFPEDQVIRAASRMALVGRKVVEAVQENENWTASSPELQELVERLVKPICEEFSRSPELFPIKETLADQRILFEREQADRLNYHALKLKLLERLEGRLCASGMSKSVSSDLARAFMDDFHAAGSGTLALGEGDIEAAADHAASAILKARDTLSSVFGQKALALPPRAPEIWMQRDRSKGETPIAFLNRVWGPWIEAGVLYQNDIKRLGDSALVKTIRTYCRRQGVNASAVLPPPQSARLERALAQAEPGSPTEMLIRERLRGRDRAARQHRRPKAPL